MAADDERCGLIEADAAELFGRIDAEQAKLAGAPQQVARERPVFRLQTLDPRDDLFLRELARGLPNQTMLVGQPFRREHRCRIARLQQPRRPFHGER